MSTNVRVGAVQAEPVWLDLEGSVNKTVSLIESAAADGVQVVCVMPSNFSVAIREPKIFFFFCYWAHRLTWRQLGFPEVWIPGYPW